MSGGDSLEIHRDSPKTSLEHLSRARRENHYDEDHRDYKKKKYSRDRSSDSPKNKSPESRHRHRSKSGKSQRERSPKIHRRSRIKEPEDNPSHIERDGRKNSHRSHKNQSRRHDAFEMTEQQAEKTKSDTLKCEEERNKKEKYDVDRSSNSKMNSKDKDKNKSVSNVNPYSTYIKDSTIGEDAHHNLNKNTKSTKKQNHKSPGSETCLNLPATKGSLEENPYESYRNGEKTTIPEENNSVDNRKQDAKKLSEMTYSNKFGRTIKEIEAKRPTKAEPVPITSGVEEQLTKKDIASNSVDKQENVDDIPEADIKKPEPEIDLNFVNHESELFKSKSGGIYLPPAKLKQYQQDITDKNSEMYQRLHWVAIKKTINGLMNKINADNIINVIHELLEENVIRCRGLLVRSLIINQDYSPMYSNIYAALVSVINTKLPQIGELLLKRLVMNFKLYYGGNMRQECINSVRFIAHLTNQFVCDELLVLEILFTLLDEPTTISIEVACGFLRECGQFLDTNCARASNAIYERLRTLLYEADIPKRSQYMIEVLFAIRRDKYKDYPSVIQELQLIDEEDQYTHKILLEEDYDPEKRLNIFKYDPDFVINESKYQEIRREVLGDSESSDEEEEFSDDDDAASGAGSFSSEHDENEIQDNTDANMIAMRRTIYLTVNSSLDCDECVHKIMKLNIKPTQFIELARMLVDCCAQLRSYEKFFGFICERICLLNAEFKRLFAQVLNDTYENAHHLETTKIRNIAKLFAHLMSTRSLDWSECLSNVKISELTTTSSQRILLKILFQELASNLGISKLHKYLLGAFYSGRDQDSESIKRDKYQAFLSAFHKIGENEEDIQPLIDFNICQQLFPIDNPRDTRFSINFFTAIDLGPLTDELRDHLENQTKN